MATEATSLQLNLSDVIEDMFMVLTTKERDVIVQRFSLDNKPRKTLESIGQHFSVTRERIRQIEKIALGKLRRTVATTKLSILNDLADKIVMENGGVLVERKLVSEILNAIKSNDSLDANIIRLALNVNQNLDKVEKTNIYTSFWKLKTIDASLIATVITASIKALKKKADVMSDAKLLTQVRVFL